MADMNLSGRVAIVTGASMGIGEVLALDLAAHGADVVLAARSASKLEAVATQVRALGRRALAIPTDVTVASQVKRLAEEATREFGRIDILINNAGGSYGATFKRSPLLKASEADFDNAYLLNVKSAWLCGQAVAPGMLARGSGVIINLGSVAARQEHGTRGGFGIYSITKVAVQNLTYVMAAEWGPTIRVNCVAPGVIDIPRTAANRSGAATAERLKVIARGRLGTPQDVANAVTFLCSDQADYINGVVLEVNGGIKSSQPPIEGGT
ncbi:MAG: SDR family oxidoreductase [Dehalococcoidia bacterium]|nr:SDR family oxidoreductase [Dehalococcoidia bacterium]